MQKTLIGFLFLVLFLVAPFQRVHAQQQLPDELDNHESFSKGVIVKIDHEKLQNIDGDKSYIQQLEVKILNGSQKNKVVPITYTIDGTFGALQKLSVGDEVVVDSKVQPNKTMYYSVYEPYRLNLLWWILGSFVLFILIIARLKGIGALIGLCISLLTIMIYIVPQILHGADPLKVCVTGSIVILVVTTYIAHGVSLKTTVSILGTGIALGFAAWMSVWAVQVLHLSGLGNEDIYNLQVGATHPINPRGLLLGGILIGTLGALNDITTTQSITIFTLVKENPTQHFKTLLKKGMIIGQEHIASLINTLVLAYAGSSLAIFIFIALNPVGLPWWVILNNETTMEEIIRSIVGSTCLILAVPITTLFASLVAMYGKDVVQSFKVSILGEK